ncbi:OmpA family protein [Paraburkholderia sp. J63]|uniref:OmpA family protein n=1 Tax=Paraburkholderia sp. J63 TaxID=2805434 RepID=UPI002ABE0C3F|nr:OmpA family protein [Paraburkholderia sp. J63]
MVDLSNVDRLKLAQLLITVRDSAAKEGPVVIYGFADERQRDAVAIAHQRAMAVGIYLQRLGVASERLAIETKIWRADSAVPLRERNQFEVEFEPPCGLNGCENPCGTTAPIQQ